MDLLQSIKKCPYSDHLNSILNSKSETLPLKLHFVYVLSVHQFLVLRNVQLTLFSALDALYLSERQQGVYKLFARIVRPLWDGKLVQDFVVNEFGKTKTFVSCHPCCSFALKYIFDKKGILPCIH